MISLNEFRIGGYVKEISDNEFVFITEIRENIHRIKGIDEDTYHFFTNKSHGYCWSKNYEPIPLTPKILDHCDLTLNTDGYWSHLMFSIKGMENRKYRVCWGDGYMIIGTYINFLHELQNVYLALMGKHLKFDNYSEREFTVNDGYDEENDSSHNPFVNRDTFNALTDGQMGRYEDFYGTLDDIKIWLGRD